MKPVNRQLQDEFHRESEEGVDAVFERMFQVAGKPVGGFAAAFDVSENTIKTWRRRGAVTTKFLQGFAKEYGTTLDYLLYGDRARADEELILDASERMLVERYRAAPKALRDAALRVLLGGEQPGQVQHVMAKGSQITQSGAIVNVGKKKR